MQGDPSHDLQAANTMDSMSVNSTATPGSQDHRPSATGRRQGKNNAVKKSTQICRFYSTQKGCRAGSQCPYLHVQDSNAPKLSDNPAREEGFGSTNNTNVDTVSVKPISSAQRPPSKPKERTPVAKPIPSLQQKDPREFQINQVVRRFAPTREVVDGNTLLKLKLQPSDPDFPFDLEALQCTLNVPATYPQNGKPSIKIENKDIPLGFQINIERGFDSLCSGPSNRTLLQLMNDLDRHLEQFLTSEKAQTIKIVANRRKDQPEQVVAQASQPPPEPSNKASNPSRPLPPNWSNQQKADAKAKRETETRQLEARMSRVPLFSSSKDGVTFNVPLQIPKPSRLPIALQSLKEMTLIVPALYNLEPCRIKLKGVAGPEAENVELAFEKRAREESALTLMAQINYLTQNIQTLAVSSLVAPTPESQPSIAEASTSAVTKMSEVSDHDDEGIVDEDRPHLRFISHPPPEWTRSGADDEESDSETPDEDETEEDDSDASGTTPTVEGGVSLPATATYSALEKGVLLSFPQLELHGVELLELREISLTVKCDRCKETLDIKNIKAAEPASTSIRTESCNKCASQLSISYRAELMHVNSIKAGYLDLEGCTVVDMLPSRFLPTCSECSTTFSLPGILCVRGDSPPLSVCRECHHRLSFKIPEIKFLRVSSNDPRINLPLRSRRKKENLGITAGTELPQRGRCRHYAKSYRWFRFSCCNRVYACDRCHDEKEEHPNEHANRMICGWCSREQNYRPEDCSACRRSVIRKTGGGFWEGGKGTRDQRKMNRNDPRKYKRIGGGAKAG